MMVAPFRLDALREVAPAALDGPPPPRRRRRRRRGRLVAVLVLMLVAVLVAAGLAAVRLRRPAPLAAVTATMTTTVRTAAGPAIVMPWPNTGQSAIAIPSIGVNVPSGPEQPVPIASLTKMMTAYVILRDHPLGVLADGPAVTMTQTDVDDFGSDTVNDEANAQVALGEVLTERQLLDGLLVHSANNFADTLARWDAGTIPAFVAKMNQAAAQLGMAQTHYADPSGFDQASQSTASDLLKVAGPDMGNPTFAAIVKMTSTTLPVAGTISTYTPLLGYQGVMGVKSGFTTAAGGCDVVAVIRQAHGHPALILSAVTGQTGPDVLGQAGFIALNLANHVGTSIGATTVVHAGEVVAHVRVDGHAVAATAASSAAVLTWPGVTAHRMLVEGPTVSAGASRGTRVGSVVVELGTQHLVVPVRLHRHLARPTMLQRLF
jgi:serine-type D-Ala-D-Ala carboxypeptidase (penicillin-binding protein 5/6)